MSYEVFLSLLLVFVGILTLLVREKPNPFIGVRFGYTYLSREAWKKANTFAGIYSVIAGTCLLSLVLVMDLPLQVFVVLYLASVIPLAYFSYRIARETYEKEDLSSPADMVEPLDIGDWRRAVKLQAIPMAVYVLLVASLWSRIPDVVAIHFSLSGEPDSFASKTIGILVIPLTAMAIMLLLTALSTREPLIFRFPAERAYEFLLVLQTFIAAAFTLALLFNVGSISGEVLTGAILAGVLIILAMALRFAWSRG